MPAQLVLQPALKILKHVQHITRSSSSSTSCSWHHFQDPVSPWVTHQWGSCKHRSTKNNTNTKHLNNNNSKRVVHWGAATSSSAPTHPRSCSLWALMSLGLFFFSICFVVVFLCSLFSIIFTLNTTQMKRIWNLWWLWFSFSAALWNSSRGSRTRAHLCTTFLQLTAIDAGRNHPLVPRPPPPPPGRSSHFAVSCVGWGETVSAPELQSWHSPECQDTTEISLKLDVHKPGLVLWQPFRRTHQHDISKHMSGPAIGRAILLKNICWKLLLKSLHNNKFKQGSKNKNISTALQIFSVKHLPNQRYFLCINLTNLSMLRFKSKIYQLPTDPQH